MNAFEWNSTYSVGNDLLDTQHKRLLGLCRRIRECTKDSGYSSDRPLHLIVNDLAEYAREHFRTEESILKSACYPGLDEQIKEHTEYEERLGDILVAAVDDVFDVAALTEFLETWWISHILESDMKYASYLADQSGNH